MTYEAVIGIEVHVELRTRSKMFCRCPVDFGAEPNTNVCPVCLGLPGALPVPNRKAVESTIALGLALGSEIARTSVFHRKNYFYADLPKNYQISQFDVPFCAGGHLDVEVDGEQTRVGITRVHLEEDTGKSTHVGGDGRIHGAESVRLDFNRSGIPLMEVVTEPDIRSPEEARAFAQELQAIVIALGVSDARLEEGSMRFDANVSLRPAGSSEFGTKVEVKNMNSLRSLQRAVAHEIERQSGVLDAGDSVLQETRHWDEANGRTQAGRGKEGSSDYRYFQEPDLLPVEITDEMVSAITASLPELPAARIAGFVDAGVDATAARTIVTGGLAEMLDEAVAAGADPRAAANWLAGEVTAHVKTLEVESAESGSTSSAPVITGANLAELVAMVEGGELSATAAKEVLAGHPDEVERLRGGEDRLVGFLVGQVMAASGGKADPGKVAALIRERSAG